MLIIFNPAAGRRRANLLWRVLDILVANGCRLEVAETTGPGDAEALAREAGRREIDMVVAAGGDGTIAEVANGLMDSPTRLGVIPLGTANVLAHELSLPFSPRTTAAALAFGRTRTLWPGLVHGTGVSRLFVQMLGVGFDASVVRNLPVPLKRALGRGAYVCQTLRELVRYPFEPIGVTLDGQAMQAASVIVTKGTLYGGRYTLAPEAVPSEPGFSVVLFDTYGPGAALLYGAALPLNLLARAPGIRRLRARHLDFGGIAGSYAQADGDTVNWAPLCVTDAARSIQIVIG
jgi:diacylglycerol kinase (ATP)